MSKTIGIIGGLSPESTILYYRYLTRRYYELFQNNNYPEIVIYSVNFQNYIDWTNNEQWQDMVMDLTDVLNHLHRVGVDFALIACNTVHTVFDQIQEQSPIPLLSIIDATAETIKAQNLTKVGLLGTQFTMEQPFYKRGLAKYGISTITPNQSKREYIDGVILNELSKGVIKSTTQRKFHEIIDQLISQGAAGIVLGCTEIPLLISQYKAIRFFDTASIHAEKALQYALNRD